MLYEQNNMSPLIGFVQKIYETWQKTKSDSKPSKVCEPSPDYMKAENAPFGAVDNVSSYYRWKYRLHTRRVHVGQTIL